MRYGWAMGSEVVRHVLGCMTGTSLDGLDVALTRIVGRGRAMRAELLGTVSRPLPEGLRRVLLAMAGGEAHRPIEFLRAARHLGVVHAEGCAAALAEHGRGLAVDFVVAHGQSIWHAPEDRLSWQLFDPWPIVRGLGLAVCFDLRQADLIAGGQGAPITPIADPILYPIPRGLVLNLGGIVNYTHWSEAKPPEASGPVIGGGDVGPCNLLIDPTVRSLFPGQTMDRDGRLSGEAAADRGLVVALVSAVAEARGGARSLGREQFGGSWIGERLGRHGGGLSASVQLASVIAAVAEIAAQEIRGAVGAGGGGEVEGHLAGADRAGGFGRVIAAGGGARNPRLVRELGRALGVEVEMSSRWGWPAEAREAGAFAVLGALSADGVAITLPAVTGAESPGIAGSWVVPPGRVVAGR